ncbi:MAG: hypothetical protein NZ480_09770, partial [Bdellovibrionaceae bacterium]|nr:hypothetical protein [Pseudobdellovibrionaceae bacterium]
GGGTYQFGLLGSYRLSRLSAGAMGLAFRDDSAQLMSESSGSLEEGRYQLKGFYLNLLYERAF